MVIFNPHQFLADRSMDLFFIYDLTEHRFIYMNPACKEFFFVKSIDVKASVLSNMIYIEDKYYVLSTLNACKEGVFTEALEFRVYRKKKLHWLRIYPFLAAEEGQNLLMGHAEDITSYIEKIERVKDQNTKLSSVLYILAHDLAGPIGTIGSIARAVADDIKMFNTPSVELYIKLISKLAKGCNQLIHDFVDQEFINSPGVKLIKRKVDILNAITVAAEDYFAMNTDVQIRFTCRSNKTSVFVEVDAPKFMLVITNLLSNALKFTTEDGQIDIYIKENPENILITMSDTGIGIPQKYHTTLFDKFTEARRNGLKGEQSTGLGMSIVKTIIEWHSGEIWFDSIEGKGTTFFILLPNSP
jgi:two-component system sensor histidine kinase VicK